MYLFFKKIKENSILYSILFNFRNIIREFYYSIFRVIFFLLSLFFKVNNRKIICSSYNHSKISCNPKYISQYIMGSNKKRYDIVWILRNIDNIDKFELNGARVVKFLSLKYVYEMCTSKIILSNQRTNFVVGKRKSQIYVQLWHSSARLKKIEGDAINYLSKYYIRQAKKDSKKTDIMVSGSRHSSEIFRRAFWFKGKILEIGTPRNDIVFNKNENFKNIIRKKIGINSQDKIILYAPTFRTKYDYDYNLFDIERVKSILNKRFGGNWAVLLRYHPNMLKESSYRKKIKGAINVSIYEDIQELFLISDCVITDYSSVMFDFCLTFKPVFLFVPDIEKYYAKERDLYFRLEELPFSISMDMDELEKNILIFDENNYEKRINNFLKKIGSFEKGNACQKFMEFIEHDINTKEL